MVSTIIDVFRTLCNQDRNKDRTDHEGEGIDKLVDHCISDIGVACPDMSFGEYGSNIGPPGISSPS